MRPSSLIICDLLQALQGAGLDMENHSAVVDPSGPLIRKTTSVELFWTYNTRACTRGGKARKVLKVQKYSNITIGYKLFFGRVTKGVSNRKCRRELAVSPMLHGCTNVLAHVYQGKVQHAKQFYPDFIPPPTLTRETCNKSRAPTSMPTIFIQKVASSSAIARAATGPGRKADIVWDLSAEEP